METECYSPETTLVVLLGASTWPYFDDFNGSEPDTFVNSAKDLRDYFLDPHKFNLPEKNMIDLFDSERGPDEIDLEISNFLERCTAEMEASGYAPRNLIVYFVGHGGFTDGRDYYLAIRRTRKANTSASGLRMVSLATTLKEKARFLRCIIILDCCFAAAAAHHLQAPLEEVVIEKASEPFKFQDTGQSSTSKGISLLCSSSHKDPSISISHDEKHTMFSGALLHVLKTGDPYRQDECISLHTLTRLIKEYLSLTYRGTAPIPQANSPDQSEGDVAEIPLFPNLARRAVDISRDILKKFVKVESEIQCCVIVSETEERVQRGELIVSEIGEKLQRGESLGAIAERMLKSYRITIQKITGQLLHKDPYIINVSNVVSSKEMYENAISALCHSSIAIFDVTNYEPAVMLLLGIRSVVRKGVTILSTASPTAYEGHFEVPFNIKEVSVVSHSEKLHDNPMLPIGDRVLEGLDQLRRLPNYLDLPSFEAIRTLPPDLESQTPKDYTEQVLILCPFGKEYGANNWRRHIRRNLGVYIQDSAGKVTPPDLIRTLDMKSPRLVSQRLYEMIRVTSMCIVDWTAWRPNVFFEFGVRLAANEIGPVCIIEKQYKKLMETIGSKQEDLETLSRHIGVSKNDLLHLLPATSQCKELIKLFSPIEYEASAGDADKHAYERMVSYYQEVIKYVNNEEKDSEKAKEWQERWGRLPPDCTYTAISKLIDLNVEFAAKPVYTELIDSAILLSGQFTSRMLYQNAELQKKANEGADERRLAAWYYLNNRYTPNEIMVNTELANIYIDLGNQLSSTLKASSVTVDQKLADAIRQQVKEFKKLLKEKSNGNASQ